MSPAMESLPQILDNWSGMGSPRRTGCPPWRHKRRVPV